jgi:hypothetical protein
MPITLRVVVVVVVVVVVAANCHGLVAALIRVFEGTACRG